MGTESFAYDGVSRLISGTDLVGQPPMVQLLESNQYDGFGNRVQAATTALGPRSIPTDPTTNRLSAAGVAYDDRGNVSAWGPASYEYDAFDMLAKLEDGSVSRSFVYTADDERILTIKNPPSPNETWAIRDLDGKVLRSFLRTTAPSVTWLEDTIHRQGQVLATESGAGRRDAHLDHLGTIRLWTGANGEMPSHHSYHGFGEERVDNVDGQVLRFTGHERDLHRAGSCSGTTSVDNPDRVEVPHDCWAGCLERAPPAPFFERLVARR